MRFVKTCIQLLVMCKNFILLIIFNMTAHYYDRLSHEEHKETPQQGQRKNGYTTDYYNLYS